MPTRMGAVQLTHFHADFEIRTFKLFYSFAAHRRGEGNKERHG